MEIDAVKRDSSIKNFNIGRDLGKNKCRAGEQKVYESLHSNKITPELRFYSFAGSGGPSMSNSVPSARGSHAGNPCTQRSTPQPPPKFKPAGCDGGSNSLEQWSVCEVSNEEQPPENFSGNR